MKFKTSISKITDDGFELRGEKLLDQVEGNFSDTIFLLLRGKKPSAKESKLFSAMLTIVIDHGMGTTSALTTRFITSGGNSLNTAVGGGILSLGDYHGGAIEKSMRQQQEIAGMDAAVKKAAKLGIDTLLERKERLFGFGHEHYKDEDPRVTKLLELCKSIQYTSTYLDLIQLLETELHKAKGRKFVLNIDGVIAAILLEMGFTPEVGKGFFIIGRTPGLVAQSMEEKQKEKPVRRIPEDQIEYDPKYEG